MQMDLSGTWQVQLGEDGKACGEMQLPGILQANGFGEDISIHTPWVSSLHDEFWYTQEEFQYAQENGTKVPFLSQPPKHFVGTAYYSRKFVIDGETNEEWFLFLEITKWRSSVWVDGEKKGEDCCLCAPHEISLGHISPGEHEITICIDNSLQYPYRPDAHSISDALGASWNGCVGEISLLTAEELQKRQAGKTKYAKEHPSKMEVRDGEFVKNGKPFFFRATHFGGDFPMTGYPMTEISWWKETIRKAKEYGVNGFRCHSFCPPEAAFQAADEEDFSLLIECGMWNKFSPKKATDFMEDVLWEESTRILKAFGHHPSFLFFSSGNEPAGEWYQPLKNWVCKIRDFDAALGYAGRRIYTAESGWFYDEAPKDVTGTDFLYFHRSAYGPYTGGTIRNSVGWKGHDYHPSLEGCKLPVMTHELGQWCAYPDFEVVKKFTGYLRPGNFEVFRENARAAGLLPLNKELAHASGKQQLRMYKEDLEATFRTPEIQGFELLDLHDYLGQGTALVGVLDSFWDSKGSITPEEFREFCADTVLLIRNESYSLKAGEERNIQLEIAHFGDAPICDAQISWRFIADTKVLQSGKIKVSDEIPVGERTRLGTINLQINTDENLDGTLAILMEGGMNQRKVFFKNHWQFGVFAKKEVAPKENVLLVREWQKAKKYLAEGKKVLFMPYLTALDFECPALAMKNIFWNGQLGPTWARPLGISVQKDNSLFSKFPTSDSGGWQWEDILDHARGFRLDGLDGANVLVRAIDDWNRNIPLGLIWEAKVGAGSLLTVSANLDGKFEERPGAFALRNALVAYMNSNAFAPTGTVEAKDVEAKLFPIARSEALLESVSYNENVKVTDGNAILEASPNSYTRMEKQDFPVTFEMKLKNEVDTKGILLLPVQRDRAHEGFVESLRVEGFLHGKKTYESAIFHLKNTTRSQKLFFEREVALDSLKISILSAYGCVEKDVWDEEKDGWHTHHVPARAVVQIAGLHLLCDESFQDTNDVFWAKAQKSNAKEIEA